MHVKKVSLHLHLSVRFVLYKENKERKQKYKCNEEKKNNNCLFLCFVCAYRTGTRKVVEEKIEEEEEHEKE